MVDMAHAPADPIDAEPSSEPAIAPLIVDVDGSLIRTDLLLEGLVSMAARSPALLPSALAAMLRGRAALKSLIARQDGVDIETLPLEPAVVDLITERQAAGQPVMLVSGADHSQVSRLAARVGIHTAHGTREVNLTGPAKLKLLRQLCSSFDYVGNATADVPLWSAATRAYAVNANPVTLWLARRKRPDLIRLSTPNRSWGTWFRALRPHQWAKNLLILLPAVAAHVEWTSARIVSAIAGLIAFSLAASAIYVLNDLADVPYDRRHLTKRSRPFASGALSPGQGILLTALLGTSSGLIAAFLPKEFGALLAVYVLLSATYTLGAKRIMALDVILLASLYTLRVIAGAALEAVPLSRWFLGFSIFLFLALALIKRVVELQESTLSPAQLLGGRGYISADTPMLIALGLGATIASSLVYCLYITSDDVLRLYHRPDLLWGNLPILLYWQARTWLLVNRHQMHEDPVVFALRDRVSHISLLAFLAFVFLAAR